jgi:hypothetical protein
MHRQSISTSASESLNGNIQVGVQSDQFISDYLTHPTSEILLLLIGLHSSEIAIASCDYRGSPPRLAHVQNMGYAHSKPVADRH